VPSRLRKACAIEKCEEFSDADRSNVGHWTRRRVTGAYDTLAPVECVAHPGAEAKESCSVCKRALCASCLVYDVNGHSTCEACGDDAEERGVALGSSVLALVGVAYLAALALGFLVFRGRAFIGGLAAVVAIAIGRGLQVFLKPPVVTRR
jgi:hypothetical protein